MPITAGKVVYSRTIQVRQFEPRHVEIEVAFEVQDKEKFQDLLDEATEIAKDAALDLVNQRER
jgi:hypothetical protein